LRFAALEVLLLTDRLDSKWQHTLPFEVEERDTLHVLSLALPTTITPDISTPSILIIQELHDQSLTNT
jgi:hypothetical protein